MNEQSMGVTSTEQTSFIESLRQAQLEPKATSRSFTYLNYAALFIGSVHVSWIVLFWLRAFPLGLPKCC